MPFHFSLKNTVYHYLQAGLVVMNALSFYLRKFWFLLHIWRIILYYWLAITFITLNTSFYSLLACRVSAGSIVGHNISPGCFWNSVCTFDSWQFYYNVYWESSFCIEIIGCSISFINLNVQFSTHIWELFSYCIFLYGFFHF